MDFRGFIGPFIGELSFLVLLNVVFVKHGLKNMLRNITISSIYVIISEKHLILLLSFWQNVYKIHRQLFYSKKAAESRILISPLK